MGKAEGEYPINKLKEDSYHRPGGFTLILGGRTELVAEQHEGDTSTLIIKRRPKRHLMVVEPLD